MTYQGGSKGGVCTSGARDKEEYISLEDFKRAVKQTKSFYASNSKTASGIKHTTY